MNIDDVKTEDTLLAPGESAIHKIFIKQAELAHKYGPIESRNGFYHPLFVTRVEELVTGGQGLILVSAPAIDDAQFQSWIKNFFWRATEELAEAMECFPDMRRDNYLVENWDKDATLRHFYEEVADAVHFVVEVSIVAGIDPAQVESMFERELMLQSEDIGKGVIESSVKDLIFDTIVAMGLAANCLKNKPWKTSQMQTDHGKFHQKMLIVWSELLQLLVWLNLDANALYSLYVKKNTVNAFRQASNY